MPSNLFYLSDARPDVCVLESPWPSTSKTLLRCVGGNFYLGFTCFGGIFGVTWLAVVGKGKGAQGSIINRSLLINFFLGWDRDAREVRFQTLLSRNVKSHDTIFAVVVLTQTNLTP